MTKEARIPNYGKRAAGETVDSAEEAFWMGSAEARALWQEAKELHLIFSSIWRK